mmetsp:Transcript_5874/g.13673  ORF Transcript_5874/g.13673 Transcript_5874/m.13673 type:complete len:197 (+) Transcript_5874:286-876(+)
MYSTAGKEKIAMIGSGNFGSALVRILGRNALEKPEFDPTVTMYVHEEMIDGKPLTQIINETNENVKYLKGAKFTPNVVAEPSLEKAVEGATMVCFCLPHQFLKPLMPAIKASVAPGAKALSAIKGIDFDDKGIVLISDIIRQELSADCSVLMGANVRPRPRTPHPTPPASPLASEAEGARRAGRASQRPPSPAVAT